MQFYEIKCKTSLLFGGRKCDAIERQKDNILASSFVLIIKVSLRFFLRGDCQEAVH